MEGTGFNIGRILIVIGVLFVIAGLPWPWLQKVGLFRLPGDIAIEREHFRFYFPISTSILLSILLSGVLMLLFWMMRK